MEQLRVSGKLKLPGLLKPGQAQKLQNVTSTGQLRFKGRKNIAYLSIPIRDGKNRYWLYLTTVHPSQNKSYPLDNFPEITTVLQTGSFHDGVRGGIEGLPPGIYKGRTWGQLWGKVRGRGRHPCCSERQDLWKVSPGGAQAPLPRASSGSGFRKPHQNQN